MMKDKVVGLMVRVCRPPWTFAKVSSIYVVMLRKNCRQNTMEASYQVLDLFLYWINTKNWKLFRTRNPIVLKLELAIVTRIEASVYFLFQKVDKLFKVNNYCLETVYDCWRLIPQSEPTISAVKYSKRWE